MNFIVKLSPKLSDALAKFVARPALLTGFALLPTIVKRSVIRDPMPLMWGSIGKRKK